MKTIAVGLPLLLAALSGVLVQEPEPVATEQGGQKVMIIPVSDDESFMVDETQAEFIIAALDRAEEEGYARVVLVLDTFGGYVFSAREMTERLLRMKIPTTAYVETKAISAGVFIAWACNDIVMEELTTMGNAQMIMQTPEGIEAAPEKAVSVYRDDWQKASTVRNRSFALARAFFDIDVETLRVGTETEFTFMTRRQYDRLPEETRPPILEVICESGELLTLNADEAAKLGIATVQPSLEAYLESIDADTSVTEEMEMTVNQEILRYIGANPWIFLVLTLIGLNGLYMELKAPGFGIPGLTAIVCFTVVFGARYFLGTADAFEMTLFVVGLLLCAAEIFVIPGFGVAGVLGLVSIFTSLVLASLPDLGGIPRFDWQWEMIRDASLPIFGSFALSVVTVIFVVPLVFEVPMAQRNLLPNEMTAEAGFVYDSVPERDLLVGQEGIVEGGLRPTGKIRLADGHVIDVVSEGVYVDSGAAVLVDRVEGNRVIVRLPEEQEA